LLRPSLFGAVGLTDIEDELSSAVTYDRYTLQNHLLACDRTTLMQALAKRVYRVWVTMHRCKVKWTAVLAYSLASVAGRWLSGISTKASESISSVSGLLAEVNLIAEFENRSS